MKPALLYFALVFGAGFILGAFRTLWAAPRFGARTAELVEAPIMVFVSAMAARWVIRRLSVPPARSARLAMGGGGLALLLAADFGLVLWLRGLSIGEYFATRDPVSGAAYYVALSIFAIMPLLVGRK